MSKQLLIIILLFIPLISSLNIQDSPIICHDVYYFMIDHMDKNNQVSYTDLELVNLSNKISLKLNNISKEDVEYYIKNFTECTDYSLPSPIINTPSSTNIIVTCNPYTNSTVLFGLISQDWNWRLGSINLGELDCDTIDSWKSLASFEINGTTYSLTGVRVYPFIFLGMIGLVGLFFYLRKIKKESDKLSS